MASFHRRNLNATVFDPLLFEDVYQAPVVGSRDPATTDKAEYGTVWVNKSSDAVFVITSITANSANWENVAGGAATFTTVTATAGITAGTTLTATAGNVNVTAGDVVLTAGDVLLTAGDIVATLGDITASAGDIVATVAAVEAGTTVTGGTGVIATTGNVTSTAGDVEAATATKGFICGSGLKVIDGAGSPHGSVTAPKGSLYLRTDGTTTNDRAYINTDSSTTWTALTTAA